MRHKHYDLIKAWADGAQIEYLTRSKRWYYVSVPCWDENTEYRIKPISKYQVLFYTHVNGEREYYVSCSKYSTVEDFQASYPHHIFDRFLDSHESGV